MTPSHTSTQASLDSLIARIIENPDLNQGILPFLMPTFVKLKQISQFIEGTTPTPDNFQAFYEFKQVCTTDLPNAIEHYCALPIELRNTQILKNKKTAHELLIDNLKGIIVQVGDIENSLLSKEAKEFLVNNAYLDKKFSTTSHDLSFTDSFNYQEWAQTGEAKNLYIVKPANIPPAPAVAPSPSTSEKALELASKTRHSIAAFLQLINNNLAGYYGDIAGVSIGITLVGAFFYTVALPFRYDDNQGDIATNLTYAINAMEGATPTKEDLNKVLKRVVDYHENKVGDFFPLLEAKVIGEEIVLKYEIDGEQSCRYLAYSVGNILSSHNINASFKIDNVVYQNYAINNTKDFSAISEHIVSMGGGMLEKYIKIRESINPSQVAVDNNSPSTAPKPSPTEVRNLELYPAIINLPAALNTGASSYYKNCSLGKVEFEIKLSPNAPIPVYSSAKKLKL